MGSLPAPENSRQRGIIREIRYRASAKRLRANNCSGEFRSSKRLTSKRAQPRRNLGVHIWLMSVPKYFPYTDQLQTDRQIYILTVAHITM